MQAPGESPAPPQVRPTCWRCQRPHIRCLCALLNPPVDNRTLLRVLQHPRERSHPFGTARLLELGLARCTLEVAWGDDAQRVHRHLDVSDDCALLYPSDDAEPLEALAAGQRPRELLVLDGTWWQAHCLYRDNPWLQRLRRVRIDPRVPSRYRIRREPAAHCLSTLESSWLALRALEPETEGLDRLMRAFEQMVDRQADFDGKRSGPPRKKRPRRRPPRRVPAVLHNHPERVVVVYGEATQVRDRHHPQRRELLQWVALRPATGERFGRVIAPRGDSPDAEFLRRMEIDEADLRDGCDAAQFLRDWAAFSRPDDVLAMWNASTLRLFRDSTSLAPRAVQLKAAYCNLRGGHCGGLEEVIAREHLTLPALSAPGLGGRAARRLSRAVAITRWLSERR